MTSSALPSLASGTNILVNPSFLLQQMTLQKHSGNSKKWVARYWNFGSFKSIRQSASCKTCQKLDFYGIYGKTLSWIQSFLNNRQQNVVINVVCSSSCAVTSGVPQGSVLGDSYSIPTIYQLKVLKMVLDYSLTIVSFTVL